MAHPLRRQAYQPEHASVTFRALKLSCGYYDYNESRELCYLPESQWDTTQGSAKFAQSQLIITYVCPTGSMRIEIPYRTIEAVLTFTKPTSLTFTLWEAPRFFQLANPELDNLLPGLTILAGLESSVANKFSRPLRERLAALPCGTAKHSEIIGQCLVYRIEVAPQDFHAKLARLRERDLLSISPYDFPAAPLSKPSMATSLKSLHTTINESVTAIPFGVLFQLQALVQNGYILPWIAEGLIREFLEMITKAKEATKNGAASGTQVRTLAPDHNMR